ncbi:phage major capsid protein [Sphingopyxis witflariensis]|uniref:Phage major capsid protein n=1 Tax=Sphingopyxis witflariensis TaxID=173675 RepID=A0A246K4E4_9SPHN|nr:phage major capsid protein [Sphingopyxis witflariensis]OWR00872.1 phage major capsid protein [Sphingopyxis witflariensis]
MTVSSLPKGSTFVRYAMALAVGKDVGNAAAYAASRWGEGSQVHRILKGAVSAGDTAGWGEELVSEYGAAAADFLGLVRERTIIGRLPGLRRVPPLTPFLRVSSGATASWIAEGGAMAMRGMTFARDSLETLKIAALTVLTEELASSADPAAESMIRADLISAIVEASDTAFIDPGNSGTPGEQPAAVTNGITAVTSGGDFTESIETLTRTFAGDLTAAYFVGRPELFVQISGIEYPNIGARGGEIAGIPALASRYVPMGAGDTYDLALIDPSGITYTSDEAGTELKTARHASIQFDDAPTMDSVEPTGANMINLWQVNGTAIAALLRQNWIRTRPGSVALLTGIAAGSAS